MILCGTFKVAENKKEKDNKWHPGKYAKKIAKMCSRRKGDPNYDPNCGSRYDIDEKGNYVLQTKKREIKVTAKKDARKRKEN